MIAKTSTDSRGRRRVFHAALYGNYGKRIARPPLPDPLYDLFDSEIDKCVASKGAGMWTVYEIETLRARIRAEGEIREQAG
jgi:hypothetical protein